MHIAIRRAMKIPALLACGVAVFAAGAVWLQSHVERFDDSFVLVLENQPHDVIGMADNWWTHVSRQCSQVHTVPVSSLDWLAVRGVLSDEAQFQYSEATPLTVMRQGAWYMVEVELSALEPAIVLMEHKEGGFDVHDDAAWSGAAGPLMPGPLIRGYFQKHFSEAPDALIDCFEPALEQFRP
jgi:hypothetical protein